MKPTLPQFAAALIALIEGSKLTAYQDPGGVWTIGIGHTGPDVHEGMTITSEQEQQLFAQDQKFLLTQVQNQPLLAAAAYVSFGFNCGIGALENVLRGEDSIGNPKHTTDRSGNVLPGLMNRRRLELMLIALGE